MDIIKPTLHHVTFKTTQLERMVAWYGSVLGAEVIFRNEHNAWMSNDAANHRIAFLSAPGLDDDPLKRAHNGMHHCAFEYDSFADLMASYARLRDGDIHPAFCLDHGMTISIYYKDPDGNFVELQSDNYGDWSASSAWMRSAPAFRANPIGVPFDAEQVHRAHAGGMAFKELQAAIRAERYLPSGPLDIGLPSAAPAPGLAS